MGLADTLSFLVGIGPSYFSVNQIAKKCLTVWLFLLFISSYYRVIGDRLKGNFRQTYSFISKIEQRTRLKFRNMKSTPVVAVIKLFLEESWKI